MGRVLVLHITTTSSSSTLKLFLGPQDVAEALRRLPPDVIVARNCRLRRAADLDLKHDHLHGELLAKQTPGESYLQVCDGQQQTA